MVFVSGNKYDLYFKEIMSNQIQLITWLFMKYLTSCNKLFKDLILIEQLILTRCLKLLYAKK